MTAWAAVIAAGFVRVTGRERVDLLHRLSTNDLRPLATPGRAATTVFANEKGRVVDWVGVHSDAEALLLRTSAGRAPALMQWLDKYIIMEDVRLADVTHELAHFVVEGEHTRSALPAPGEVSVEGDVTWTRGVNVGVPRFEGVVPAAKLPAVLESLRSAGLRMASPTEVEQARIRAGVPSPEHEFKDEVNPLELRLGEVAVSFTKGCYIGQEVIARLDAYDKLARVLMGFEGVAPPVAPDAEFKLVQQGRPLGRVTSWFGEGDRILGLAVIKREAAQPGPAQLMSEGVAYPVELLDRPFWQAARVR